MIHLILSNLLYAQTPDASITVTGQKIPKAAYKLNLEVYDLQLSDYRFPSGLRVLFQSERTQPVIAITSVIDRGSEYDQENMDGIAHVVEHLAFRARHADVKNWDLIKQMGGSINASTSVDWTNYMTVAPSDALIPLLRIEALRMQNGLKNVTEQAVRTESEIARNELRMRYENAAVGAAWDEIGKALYPDGHPYARSTIGDHETLSNISLEKAQEYVQNNYRPEYTTIVVAGDFSLQESGQILLDAFNGAEELLMTKEDAEAFLKLEDTNEQIKFLNETMPKIFDYLQKNSSEPFPPRVDCSDPKRYDLPMPTQKKGDPIPRVKGMIDSTTVVVAWSLPGGYCDDQPIMQMTAGLLTNYVRQELYPSWEYAKEDSPLSGLSCFLSPEQYASSAICFVSQRSGGGYSPEKIAEKVKDSLYRQWEQYDPNMVNTFLEWNFNYARSSEMASMLQSVDLVSSLGGRATNTAMFTHFTGDPAYFSTNMNRLNKITPEATREVAQKYITRERAVTVIVEPMDNEEKARLEAAAQKESRSAEVQQYHATQDADRYTSIYSTEDVTPELIEQQVVQPDFSEMENFTLTNGMNVFILPYGEAPLVRAALKLRETGEESIPGLNSLSNYSYYMGDKSKESLLAVAGFMSGGRTSVMTSLPSGNLAEGLEKLRWYVEPSNHIWVSSYDKKKRIDSWKRGSKNSGNDPETWSRRLMYENLFPENSNGDWMSPFDYDPLYEVSNTELKKIVYDQWQPQNVDLYIIGKIDPQDAKDLAKNYFDSWSYFGEGDANQPQKAKRAEKLPERKILVFDKETATQSQITMMCRIDTEDEFTDRPRSNVVSSVLSEDVWRKLREEAGVTYGAYAYDMILDNGDGALGMQSLIQNDAVGFGVETMYNIVDRASKGDVNANSIANAKMSIAREYVLGQQSGQQMLRRLMSVGIDNFDYFQDFPKLLAGVNKDDFSELLAPCVGKEIVTVVGPEKSITKQLDERNLAYEVIDWNELYFSYFTPKELKKYNKKKAKSEKKKAKEESKK